MEPPSDAQLHLRTLARRFTLTLFTAQSLGSAGFLAAATINAIVGARLSGHLAWAGMPSAVYQGGAALAAFAWGHLMDRLGRRRTLALGTVAGAVGAAIASLAITRGSFGAFLCGLLFMGFANSALQLGRFVAAEVHPPTEKGRAISNVVLGGTVGALFGPALVGPAGRWAVSQGVDELAGPYVGSAMLLLAACGVILFGLRPEPREVARMVAARHPVPGAVTGPTRPSREVLRDPGVAVAIVTMVSAQVVMVMLMVITSLHMKDHHHPLSSISLVISSHVVGMYAFSLLSGRLADGWGRAPVMVTGAAILVVSCLAAPVSPAVLPTSVALFLLGLGWNFCYVGGSSLLADRLRPAERARTQGVNDFLVGLVSAAGSLGSGVIFAAVGYGAMSLVGAVAALLPLGLTLWWRPRSPGLSDEGASRRS